MRVFTVKLIRPVLLIAGLFWAGFPLQAADFERLEIHTKDKTLVFQVEMARTPNQRATGLMFRRTMAADHGMLFDFERDDYVGMWMKNTFIPLDMLFISADGVIKKIVERTVPKSLTPISSDGPVRAVLELNGGTADRLEIRNGDRVSHSMFHNMKE